MNLANNKIEKNECPQTALEFQTDKIENKHILQALKKEKMERAPRRDK